MGKEQKRLFVLQGVVYLALYIASTRTRLLNHMCWLYTDPVGALPEVRECSGDGGLACWALRNTMILGQAVGLDVKLNSMGAYTLKLDRPSRHDQARAQYS